MSTTDRPEPFVVLVAGDLLSIYEHPDLTLDALIDREARLFAERGNPGVEPERIITRGDRVLAILRPRIGDREPEVIRLVGPDDRPAPKVAGIVTDAQAEALNLVRILGEKEAFARLYLSGKYDDRFWGRRDRRGAPDGPASPPGGSADEDEVDAEALPHELTDRAIGRYWDTLRRCRLAHRLAESAAGLEAWATHASRDHSAARESLIAAILAFGPGFEGEDVKEAVTRRWPARGVRQDRWFYLALPNEDVDEVDARGRRDMMVLRAIEASAIAAI